MCEMCREYKARQLNKANRWVIVDNVLKLRTFQGTYRAIGEVSKGVCPHELLAELRKLRKCLSEDGPKVLAEVNARPIHPCRHECFTTITFFPPRQLPPAITDCQES